MLLLLACAPAWAQRPIGTVSTASANVGGVLETSGGTATIVNNGTVTAQEQTATVTLARGGAVNVCATSTVHLSQSNGAKGGPLLVALDRGALELNFLAGSNDAVLTPDMRIQPASPAPLDLRIRVVNNGDTCVENRGSDAPALMISDTFGESSYIVHPRQHVLFEHGDLKQVVDNETSPCGCPPAVVVSVADAGVSGATVAKAGSAVETHPFPEAVSEGLATAPPPQAATGHVSTGLALSYNTNNTEPAAPASQAVGVSTGAGAGAIAGAAEPAVVAPAVNNAVAVPATAPVVAQAPPPPPPPTDDLAHVFVRFYRWIFHRKPSPTPPQS
jgi:hypothetical protein